MFADLTHTAGVIKSHMLLCIEEGFYLQSDTYCLLHEGLCKQCRQYITIQDNSTPVSLQQHFAQLIHLFVFIID